MKLISDLHFEFYEDQAILEEKGDILVIAGDLCVGADNAIYYLKHFAKNYDHIIYVPGNHEYYGGSIDEFDSQLKNTFKNTNVHFLNPGFVKIDNKLFIGATLWTNFRNNIHSAMAAGRQINDFRIIKGFNPRKAIDLFNIHYKFIQDAYKIRNDNQVYIVTHFLPTLECVHPRYHDALNHYFANDLGDFVYELDATWMFGHTHDRTSFSKNDAILEANPYGYNLNSNFKSLEITSK